MKIAVQFFGHLRTFEECAPSVKTYLLNEYDCDVFMHTWSKTEHNTQTWHDSKCNITDINQNTVERLKKLYNPVMIEIEEQDINKFDEVLISCQHNDGTTKISSRGIKFMLYSKNKVNQLRKKYQQNSKVEYDYVIMIRPDIELCKRFVLDEAIKEIEFLKLKEGRYSAINFGGNDFPVIGSNASDILYFAKPLVVDKMLEVLTSLDFNTAITKGFWNPETFYIVELQKRNIESYFIDYKYNEAWRIVRPKKKKVKWTFKDFLKVRINKKLFSIVVFGYLDSVIFNLEVLLFSKFRILIRLGNVDKKL